MLLQTDVNRQEPQVLVSLLELFSVFTPRPQIYLLDFRFDSLKLLYKASKTRVVPIFLRREAVSVCLLPLPSHKATATTSTDNVKCRRQR